MKMHSTADLVTESTGDLTESRGDLTAEEKPKKFKDMTNSERIKFVREVVTLEPVLVTYFLGVAICGAALIALEVEKACKSDAKIPDEICEAIVRGEHAKYGAETAVLQEVLANTNSWASIADQVIPIVLVIFIGSFSDRHKIRKIFIILPLVGELLSVIGCIINWYFMKELPLVGLVVLNRMVSSIFGSVTLLTMAVFTYIADNSTVEMRTLRVGLLQLSISIFYTIGRYATGPLFKAVGYLPVFLLTWFLIFVATLYAVFFVKEKREVKLENKIGLCRDVFNPSDLVNTFSLLIKKTVGCNRLFLSLLLFIWICIRVAMAGPTLINQNFTQKLFLWSPDQLTQFNAVEGTVGLIGTSLGIFLFTKLLKFSDFNIVNFTLLLAAISEIISAFSASAVPFYVGGVVRMFGTMNTIGIRSISTKICTDESVGKMQSLMAVCEAIAGMISAPLYNQVYKATAETFAGFAYLLSSLISCLAGGLVLLLNVLIIKKENKKADEGDSRPNDLETNGMQMTTTHI